MMFDRVKYISIYTLYIQVKTISNTKKYIYLKLQLKIIFTKDQNTYVFIYIFF